MASGGSQPLLNDAQPPAYSPQEPGKAPGQHQYAAGSYQGGAPAGSTGPYMGPPGAPAGATGPYMGPPGYQVMPGQQPSYMQQPQTIIVQPQAQVIAVVGGCPACRVGVLEDDFTCLGVCCAILFFPIGILCCLLMRQRRCPNCGAVFG